MVVALRQDSLAQIRLKGERGLGRLPCLVAKGGCWLQTQGEIAERINV